VTYGRHVRTYTPHVWTFKLSHAEPEGPSGVTAKIHSPSRRRNLIGGEAKLSVRLTAPIVDDPMFSGRTGHLAPAWPSLLEKPNMQEGSSLETLPSG